MSRGIFKLFNIFLVLILFSSCSTKTSKNVVVEVKKIKTNKIKKPQQKIKSKIPKKNELKRKELKKSIIKSNQRKKIHKRNIPKKSIYKKKIIKKQIQNKPLLPIKISTKLDKNHLKDFYFDIIKKGNDNNNTLLIVGGIQGDEPGGFMAASLIATHYKILKGSVWIVPNLNFYSIIKRSRGPFGDMNRKFGKLSPKDPEYEIVQKIKYYITRPTVKLILNLHDGSGYYRPKWIDRWHNQYRWGQSVVIDQKFLPKAQRYKDLDEIAKSVVKHINKHLLKEEDFYRVKNTHTRRMKTFEEKEMSKTLTYFAINKGKSAFGHETSKDLNVAQRVYYKLLAIEKFMQIMGIKFERRFPLTLKGVRKALNDDISIKFDDINITIPLKDIRKIQKYFPVDKNGVIHYLPSNPLLKIIKQGRRYILYYGNRRLTTLYADYSKHLSFDTTVTFEIDGIRKKVKFGDTVKVKDCFMVIDEKKFRVNVIGYKNKSGIETNVKIRKNYFIKKYSIENKGQIYRVEFYKGKNFVGMVLVKFVK